MKSLNVLSREVFPKDSLVAVLGHTGAGKTALSNYWTENFSQVFEHAVMPTTRLPREAEIKRQSSTTAGDYGLKVGYYEHLQGNTPEERKALFHSLHHKGLIAGGVQWGPQADWYGVFRGSINAIIAARKIPIVTMAGTTMGERLREDLVGQVKLLPLIHFARADHAKEFLRSRSNIFPKDALDFEARMSQFFADVLDGFKSRERLRGIYVSNELLPKYSGSTVSPAELDSLVRQRLAYVRAWNDMGQPQISDEFFYNLNIGLLERLTGKTPEQLLSAAASSSQVRMDVDDSLFERAGHGELGPKLKDSIRGAILDFRLNEAYGVYILVLRGPELKEARDSPILSERQYLLDLLQAAAGFYPIVRIDAPDATMQATCYSNRFTLGSLEGLKSGQTLEVGANFGGFRTNLRKTQYPTGLAVVFAPTGYPPCNKVALSPSSQEQLESYLTEKTQQKDSLTYLRTVHEAAQVQSLVLGDKRLKRIVLDSVF